MLAAMSRMADLTLFSHVANRAEDELNLAQAALLIAEPEYPGLDVLHYVELLDRMGQNACRLVENARPSPDRPAITIVVELVFGELGFAGNAADYQDPRNSFLNEVLERRLGIPITLALVLTEVATRAGIKARGVSFPGHFLVRAPSARGPVFVDPFAGRILTPIDLRELHQRVTGIAGDPPTGLLEPAPKQQILIRMLGNLRQIYTARSDLPRLRQVLERMQLLAPSEGLERQLESLGESPGGDGGKFN